MLGLVKFASFWATCLLFLNGLGAVDLAAWCGESFKDHVETALQGKELLASVAELITGSRLEHAVAVEAAVATPGVAIVAASGLISLIKFLIRICLFAAVVALGFIIVQQNAITIQDWRNNLQPEMVPGQPLANLGIVLQNMRPNLSPVIPHPEAQRFFNPPPEWSRGPTRPLPLFHKPLGNGGG
jgi:hypothetical protein